MDHTHIVQANDLDRYSETRDSESTIPELVYLLVRQSVPDATECRIPYGGMVNDPGWDGIVDVARGFGEFVPTGRSFWEIGTGADPKTKATEDYRKRTLELPDAERGESTFVFVTPRTGSTGGWSQPAQQKWIKDRQNGAWRAVRILDGLNLANWLREFPALGRWMASKMGITQSLGGLSTPAEHWKMLVSGQAEEPKLPAKLFTAARENACEAMQSLFEARTQRLLLFTESSQEVFDFVAGYLETLEDDQRRDYSNRCLFVSEEDAWRSVVESRKSHVLVADAKLGLESDDGAPLLSLATTKGHGVVIPLNGAWQNAAPEIVRLRSASRSQIEQVLKDAGFQDVRAKELASVGGDKLSALLRSLRGLGAVPPYATWANAGLLAQAGLAGKWDATNPRDVAALEALLGKAYGEWIETLRADVLRSEAPLAQRDEKWRMVARGEAWNALGNRLFDDDLDRLLDVAVRVLAESNPKFELPKEQQFAAAIHGKHLAHSTLLREGLADTLALLGSRPQALSSCSQGRGELTAVLAVRRILDGAPWRLWASLDSLLPLLAEAAPDEFLDAVEAALADPPNSPFHGVFAQEGGGLGWNYMSGLLWALETLAWNKDLLSRVCVVLADLASIDPGGKYANRPSSTLVEILVPWHYQTCAPLERRKAAVEAVLREQPEVGWKLVLALLPHSYGIAMGSRQPTWRSYIPKEWSGKVTQGEYWDQIEAYTELAVRSAMSSGPRLEELIEHWPDLSETARERLTARLGSAEIAVLPEEERIRLWDSAIDLVNKHRKFADAEWAMPEEALVNLEAAANALVSDASELRQRRLFNKNAFDLFDENGDYEGQAQRVADARQQAVLALVDAGGVAAVRAFARTVAHPDQVGIALGLISERRIDREIIPSLLDSDDEVERRFVSGFVWGRAGALAWDWVDEMLAEGWSAQQKAGFLRLLPFEEQTWNRVAAHLESEDEGSYWRSVQVNPYGPDRDLSMAIQKLIEHGRADAAIFCIDTTIGRTPGFDSVLAIQGLLAVLQDASLITRLDQRTTANVIRQLQLTPGVDVNMLFTIEWSFLPWLGRYSSASPTTIEARLATDPGFFAEVVALVFRPKNQEAPRDPPSERTRALARNAYGLLSEWRTCPGQQANGRFDGQRFAGWLQEAKRVTTESGHLEIALNQLGHMLIHAPADPDGLWIHHAIASALNERGAETMRSGFTTALYNSRGVHGFSAGKDERELAKMNRNKADALDQNGYSRFATAMREFAAGYDREADAEATRDQFER